ncbi:MAG: amidohydrolase, partial [Planctomycetes bacterium]|nr:amidohydrolase [Planctomycetota bacterium]
MDFVKLAKGVEKEIITTRRDFHAHPEVAFEEVRTSGIIEKRLRKLGIRTVRMAKTGIAGYLDTTGAKRTVALRADIDALPLKEKTRLKYASKNDKMHACGHDCHAAILLGVARILSQNRSHLAGNVRFIFQLAEEKVPGGARLMVREGVMDGVDEVYGLHVASQVPSGRIVAEAGAQMANVDSLFVTITGKGAHGASPHLSVDPV